MNAATQPAGRADFRKYEVDSRICNVTELETVSPDTVIGYHYASGQPVRSGLLGQVATIYFNPMHDSLMVMVLAAPARSDHQKTAVLV